MAHGGDSAIRNVFRSWWREEGILDTASNFDNTGPMRAISSENLGGGQMTNLVGKSMRLAGRTCKQKTRCLSKLCLTLFKSKVMTEARRMTDSQMRLQDIISWRVHRDGNQGQKAKKALQKMADDGDDRQSRR